MAVAKKQMKTSHHVKDLNLAPKGHGRIEWAGRSMPVLASIREWRGSLLGSMTAHALNNFIATTFLVTALG